LDQFEQDTNRSDRQPEETGETERFSLDDILKEFGGWSAPAAEPEPAAPIAEEAPREPVPIGIPEEAAAEPEATESSEEPEPEAEAPRAPSRFRFINLDLNAAPEGLPEEPVAASPEVWSWKAETESEPQDEKSAEDQAEETADGETGRRTRRNEKAEPEQRAPVSPAAALRHYRNRSAAARLRTLFVLLLTLAAAVMTLAPLLSVPALQALRTAKATPIVLLVLLCLCALASFDLIARGISQLVKLQFGLELLLTAAFVACVIDTIVAMAQARVPYCAVVCIGFLYADWSDYLTCIANIRSLRVVAEAETPYSVKVAANAWNDLDCAFRAEESADDFVTALEAPNRATLAMRLYVPLAAAASLIFSTVSFVRAGTPLLQMLTVCLCAALPVSGFLSYSRPFAQIAARLSRSGAALCGWQSAVELSGELGAVVCDTDLYPNGTVAVNGVKVYHDFRLNQMLCYAATAISMSESNLKPLFLQLAESEGVRLAEVGSFRPYEGGGVGAEIRGDIVLVGSLGFMHLMGVRLPQGTNIRQAVYVAINGMLAGVIAITYQPGSSVVSALQTLVRRHGISIVGATRDFLISPAMLHAKFRVPTTRAEFPPVSDRYRLSSLHASEGKTKAAVLSRSTFLPFAEAIAGARSLKSTVTAGVAVSLFGGIFGLLVVFFLGMGGAIATATASNLLLFVLVWTIPGLLITTWSNKF
jgi:cation transport ATPase